MWLNNLTLNVKECKETLRRIRRMDFQTKLTWFTSLNRYSWGREWKSFKAPSAWYSRSGCPVGWRDLALFFIFENLQIWNFRYIFRSSIPKNRRFRLRARSFASHRWQSFHFQNIFIFFFIWRNLLYTSKNNRKK